jgi:hypothetical protein
MVVVAPPGGGLAVRADAPAADLLFRPPTLRTGGVLEAALEPEVGLDAEREVAPRVAWQSVREGAGVHTLAVSARGGHLTRVEGVRPDGGVVRVPAAGGACRVACDGGTTQAEPESVHYTRECDRTGCTVIATYDFVGGGSSAASTSWAPPGGGGEVPVTEVRFVIEGGAALDALRRLHLEGFETLEVVGDRFAPAAR